MVLGLHWTALLQDFPKIPKMPVCIALMNGYLKVLLAILLMALASFLNQMIILILMIIDNWSLDLKIKFTWETTRTLYVNYQSWSDLMKYKQRLCTKYLDQLFLYTKFQNPTIIGSRKSDPSLYLMKYKQDLRLWQYGLLSIQAGGTKLERFLHKNQHTQRKLLNFENWCSGELSKTGHHFSKKVI